MAQNDFLSTPATASGLTPASGATAWTYGTWVQVSAALAYDAYVLGLTFQITYPSPAIDTTIEYLFEIGTGASGSEVIQVQVPATTRADTTGYDYYKTGTIKHFLPEPMLITQGTRVAVRATDSIASAITYNGVKIFYRQGATAAAGLPNSLMLMGVGT